MSSGATTYLTTYMSNPPIHTLSLHDALPIWPVSRSDSATGLSRPRELPVPERFRSLCRRRTISEHESFQGFLALRLHGDRKSTSLNSRHLVISYAVFSFTNKNFVIRSYIYCT